MLRPGTFLQDRYEILEQIGSGGMSIVYKAKCHKLNRLVAIKVLKEEFSTDANFVTKFKMEAQAAAGLAHPNIVNVYDVVDEGELHYIVMELIEGITLKNYIAKKGYLEAKETIGIAIQVAQGIAAAHEQHIIHRDIKPQNMIISRDGKVKVADFGIARAVSSQTLTSTAMGSVHYISPEQARGGYSDARSDIYSLGITMYEMVTGRVPYEGDNTVTVALAHLEDQMVPPSVYHPEIPISLERIILKCTEKKPERRYANVNSVINDLRRALLNPDEEPKTEERVYSPLDETVQVSEEELMRIKERRRPPEIRQPVNVQRGKDPLDQRYSADIHYPPKKRVQEDLRYRKDQEIPARKQSAPYQEYERYGRPDHNSGRRTRQDHYDVNPQIEKLMAAAGIVAAVLIVSVLIFIFARVGGMVNGSTKKAESQDLSESAPVSTTEPEESSLNSTQVNMPDLLGLSEDMAEAKLKEDFLIMQPRYLASDDVEKGYVISQKDEAGEPVSKWSKVEVVISQGSDKIDLTELVLDQMDIETAKKLLENKKLKVSIVEEENETIKKGMVMRFEPERVEQQGTVTLYVSSGPHVEMVNVPEISGKTEEEAIAILAETGLKPGITEQEHSDTVPAGYIISQSGGENGQIEAGGSINYVISSGPKQQQRYVASVNESYDLSNLIGPGSRSASATLMIRLHQNVNGVDEYQTLMDAKEITGTTILPVSFTSIEGAPGVENGEVEVVEVNSGAVLKSYPLTFFPMN